MDLRAKGTIMLPNPIDKMGRLKHLSLNHDRTTTIDGERLRLGGLTKLETLIGWDSKTCYTNDLLKLTNLRRFVGYVFDIESLSMVVDHITKLKDQLRGVSLEISGRDLSSEQGSHVIDSLMHCPVVKYLEIFGRLRRFPTWEQPQLLQNLRTLVLFSSEIVEDPMETVLQHLPVLESLWLSDDAFVGTEMVCGSKGFPQLKSLQLDGLSNLEEWRVEKGAMPNLSDLIIRRCLKLKMIPHGIIFMASITKLGISDISGKFTERLRREGEDYHKISHIPSIHLGVPRD